MIRKLDLHENKTANAVMELQRASYKIEADIIGFDGIPPLTETMDGLTKCGETFYGYYQDGVLAGIASYKVEDNMLDICRLAVHPDFFRMGVADKLLKYVEAQQNSSIETAIVCTGRDNLPALSLYIKNGYNPVRDIEISQCIYITELKKALK